MPLSISYLESRTILCAEGYSTDSSTQQCLRHLSSTAQRGSLFNLQACQLVQCDAMPPMKHINPMIQVECVFGQNLVLMVIWLTERRVVTHHPVRLIRAMVLGR